MIPRYRSNENGNYQGLGDYDKHVDIHTKRNQHTKQMPRGIKQLEQRPRTFSIQVYIHPLSSQLSPMPSSSKFTPFPFNVSPLPPLLQPFPWAPASPFPGPPFPSFPVPLFPILLAQSPRRMYIMHVTPEFRRP